MIFGGALAVFYLWSSSLSLLVLKDGGRRSWETSQQEQIFGVVLLAKLFGHFRCILRPTDLILLSFQSHYVCNAASLAAGKLGRPPQRDGWATLGAVLCQTLWSPEGAISS